MKVTLRIVGLYFKEEVTVADPAPGGKITVEDVMKAARNQYSEKFNYNATASAGKVTLQAVTHKIDSDFTSEGDNIRKAGTYSLSETLVGNAATVFQYYIFKPIVDEGVTRLLSISENGKFVPFTESPEIKEGYTIVWRLVSILFGPFPAKDQTLPPIVERFIMRNSIAPITE